MTTPHVHAALIKLWADGAEIEYEGLHPNWVVSESPSWVPTTRYRIKPEPVSNKVMFHSIFTYGTIGSAHQSIASSYKGGFTKALRVEINPTTLELVSAYVVSTETGEAV